MRDLRFAATMFSTGVMILGAVTASGQDVPNQPIRIVTAAAGGGSDFVSRQIAQGISGPLGQSVIVDNRGSGAVQGEFLMKAPPDGSGLVVAGSSFWIGPLLQKLPYDVEKDFAALCMIAREVNVLVVIPSLQVNSVKELIALAKSKPGQLNYASGPTGGAAHLAGEMFKSMASVNIVNVPFKGTAPGLVAMLGGEVQMIITDPNNVMGHWKSGKLKVLAVATAEPSALVPGLPTISASGLPGYEAIGITGIFAPGKTPANVINRLNQEIVRFLRLPDTKERFLAAGEEIVASTPAQFAATIKSDVAKMGKLIKDANIKVD